VLDSNFRRYQEHTCVVCGQRFRVYDKPGESKGHRCPKAVLAAMLSAERRAWNEMDPQSETLPRHLDDRLRGFGERLAIGFAMMRGEAA